MVLVVVVDWSLDGLILTSISKRLKCSKNVGERGGNGLTGSAGLEMSLCECGVELCVQQDLRQKMNEFNHLT